MGSTIPDDLPKVQATPQEVVQFMRQLLEEGKCSWDAGLRRYLPLHYRGTLLYAYVLMVMGQLAPAWEICN